MKEKKQIATSITTTSAEKISKLAKSETRSFSLMVDILLAEALSAREKKKKKAHA
jgi:hypothetical protein